MVVIELLMPLSYVFPSNHVGPQCNWFYMRVGLCNTCGESVTSMILDAYVCCLASL